MAKKILSFIMLMFMTFSTTWLTGCGHKASHFTEAEHIERVSALVEKRYMTDDVEYTGYKVYPLYNEDDALGFFLVEFEPGGFVYVEMNENAPFISMYTRDASEGDIWYPYAVEIGFTTVVPDENGGVKSYHDKRLKTDENGNYIEYRDSHFKVANIKEEKRYLLQMEQAGHRGYIPAVKRGDKYLNLVSMDEMDFEREIKVNKYSIADIRFIPKSHFNL